METIFSFAAGEKLPFPALEHRCNASVVPAWNDGSRPGPKK